MSVKLSNVSGGAIEAIEPKSPLVSRDPNRVEYETDALGRVIGARQLSALDMFELTCLLGSHSGNQAALSQALMAASVVKIDGRDLALPNTMLELKARIKLLDFSGYLAASTAVARFVEVNEENLDAIKN